MALDTYANLKTSIINYSTRDDLLSSVDDFIDIAESEMFNHLQIRDMEARATASTNGTRYLVLPDGFIAMRKLRLVSGSQSYDMIQEVPESLDVVTTNGRPRIFTVTSQLEFDRIPDATYTVEMQYFKSLTALSSSNTSNAVLSRFPHIYLYGSLWALWERAQEEDRATYYYAKFLDAINMANKQDKKGRYGPAPAMRREGPTP